MPHLRSSRLSGSLSYPLSRPRRFGRRTRFPIFDAIYRFQDLALVVPVSFAQSKVEWVAVGVNDQVAFEALQPVFS